MKILCSYIRQNLWTAGLFLLFGSIFSVMLLLKDLPVADVLYALLLCAVFGLIAAAVDFWRYRKNILKLREAACRLPETLEGLPETYELRQQTYQEMLQTLLDALRKARTEADSRQSDMLDYYALWAHQIKTPIAAMHLLLQDEQPDRGRLSDELFHIERYVEMVLQYLRMQSDSSDLVLAWCDLDAVIRQSVRKYAPLFIRSKVTLDYQPVRCRVLTDEKWLCFVLEQLLSNALKYAPQGTVRISLEAPAVLCIRDNGIGISGEDLPRVFEKGFTGYNGRSDKKSTGIGLYLCKRVMDRLGHGISIRSRPGQGTEVRLELDSGRSIIE